MMVVMRTWPACSLVILAPLPSVGALFFCYIFDNTQLCGSIVLEIVFGRNNRSVHNMKDAYQLTEEIELHNIQLQHMVAGVERSDAEPGQTSVEIERHSRELEETIAGLQRLQKSLVEVGRYSQVIAQQMEEWVGQRSTLPTQEEFMKELLYLTLAREAAMPHS